MKSPIGGTPGQKISALGMSWYRESNYAAARAIMADAHTLPPTFAAWLAVAQKREGELTRDGHKVIRAIIDPQTFPKWCARQGFMQIDARARTAWGADYAARQIGL